MMVCDREVHVNGRLVKIAHLDGDKYESLTSPETAIAELRTAPVRVDLFTFLEKLPYSSPRHQYPMKWDNLAVMNISTFEHWWAKQINNKTRNMVRRAEKLGVVVREVPFDDELVHGITTIYNEVPNRQGKPFPHYGKDFETVRKISATFPDQSTFIGAYLEGELIGFVKLVADRDRAQASLMHIVSMYKHRDKAPTNALIAQSVRACADRGIPFLVYSNFAYGKKQRDTLSDFKEYNGFQRVDLPRYYVPLSLAGHVALRLQLHRGLADRVPESVQRNIRTLRSMWYSRRRYA